MNDAAMMSDAGVEAAHSTQQVRRTRTLRWLEWALVLCVAFLEPLLTSLYTLLPETGGKLPRLTNPSIAAGFAIARDLTAIALLIYVLFRQSRRLRDIGFNWRWTDIPVSLALALTTIVVRAAVMLPLLALVPGIRTPLRGIHPTNIPHFTLSLLPVLMMIVNPFYEELLLRAFTQSELTFLTGHAWLALTVSVGLQVAGHFYQSVPIALTYLPVFVIFALFYGWQKRIMPVILCHMYFDLTALVMITRWRH